MASRTEHYAYSGFDVFGAREVNEWIDKNYWEEILPTVTPPSADQVMEFIIPKTTKHMIDLGRTEFSFTFHVAKLNNEKMRIKVTDGVPVDADTNEYATPINLPFHTFWKQIEILAGDGDEIISKTNDQNAYQAYIETILETSAAEKQGWLKHYQMFHMDQNAMDQVNPFNTDNINPGHNERWKIVRNGDDITVFGKLMNDICQQNRYILNGILLRIKIRPYPEAFRLVTSTNVANSAKIFLSKANLRLCKVVPKTSVLSGLSAGFDVSAAQYPIRKIDIRTREIPSGSLGPNFDNLFSGEIPSKMIVAFVQTTAFNGDYSLNPLYFHHMNMKSIKVYLNGEQTPDTSSYECDFSKPNSNFLHLVAALNKWKYNDYKYFDSGITPEIFKNGCALFCFNLDPAVPTNMSIWPPPKTGTVKLDIIFGAATNRPYKMLLYSIFPGVIQVDSQRRILPSNVSTASAYAVK